MKPLTLILAIVGLACNAFAADQHLSLRLEDGLPATSHSLPITIVVPITAGKGRAGAAPTVSIATTCGRSERRCQCRAAEPAR